MALAELLGGVDPLALEARGHADVGDDDLGRGLLGAGHEAVVVARHAHDLEIGLEGEQGPHPFTHDQVVVGKEHRDVPVDHRSHLPTSSGENQGS